MANVNISENQFKATARHLCSLLEQNAQLTHNQMLETLAKQLFSKPYGEIRETLLTKSNITPVYSMDGKIFLFNKDRFICTMPDSTSVEDIVHELKELRVKTDGVEVYQIPTPHDHSAPSASYVLKRAKEMGYSRHRSPFIAIEQAIALEIKVFDLNEGNVVQTVMTNETLCGDWFDRVESDGEQALCLIVEEQGFEYYASYKDLSGAVYSEGAYYIEVSDDTQLIIKCLRPDDVL